MEFYFIISVFGVILIGWEYVMKAYLWALSKTEFAKYISDSGWMYNERKKRMRQFLGFMLVIIGIGLQAGILQTYV